MFGKTCLLYFTHLLPLCGGFPTGNATVRQTTSSTPIPADGRDTRLRLPTAAAYVEFDTVEHAAAALAALNRKPEVASGALSVHYAVCSPPPQAVIDRFVQLAPPLPAGTDLAMAARLFLEIERNTDWVLDCILPTYLGAKWWSVVLGPRTPNKDRAGAALAATLALKVLRGRETFMRVIPTPRVAEDAHAESAETSPQSDVQPSQDRGSTEALQAAVRACLERSAGDNVNRA